MSKKEVEYQKEDEDREGDLQNRIQKLKNKLEHHKKEKQQYLSGWQRERADFINYKKDVEKRLREGKIIQKGRIILEFLKILDSLEKAEEEFQKKNEESQKEPNELIQWIQGIFGIKNQIKQILESENVKEIDTKTKFNPDLHEVVETVEGDDDQIIEVIQKGYLLEGKLLRPAMVKVGKKVEEINKSNK